jgi:hypothetical protein
MHTPGDRRPRWARRRRDVGSAVVVALLLSACAGSLRPAAPKHTAHKVAAVCSTEAQADIAQALDVSGASGVSAKRSVGNNGMPQCTFVARQRSGPVSVTVNIDNGPQVPFRLERTVVEATQLFGPPPPGWHAPIGVSGLGPYASWFVNQDALMAGNGIDLLSVSVIWPRERRAGMIRLARAAIDEYMRAGRKLSGTAHTGYPG